jgi:hypothetical protein
MYVCRRKEGRQAGRKEGRKEIVYTYITHTHTHKYI